MNFEQAQKRKSELGNEVEKEEYLLEVIIVPDDRDDYDSYMNDFGLNEFDDYEAKNYSKNQKYKVIGVDYDLSGMLLWEDLSA